MMVSQRFRVHLPSNRHIRRNPVVLVNDRERLVCVRIDHLRIIAKSHCIPERINSEAQVEYNITIRHHRKAESLHSWSPVHEPVDNPLIRPVTCPAVQHLSLNTSIMVDDSASIPAAFPAKKPEHTIERRSEWLYDDAPKHVSSQCWLCSCSARLTVVSLKPAPRGGSSVPTRTTGKCCVPSTMGRVNTFAWKRVSRASQAITAEKHPRCCLRKSLQAARPPRSRA